MNALPPQPPDSFQPAERPADEDRRITVGELLEHVTPLAWVTPTLAALILVGYGIETALGTDVMSPTAAQLLASGGNFGPAFAGGEWWRPLTSMFLHAGPIHLALNLWTFWSAGLVTERVFGNVAFLALYFMSGIAGALTSLVWNPMAVGVGASGAVFGVYGALLAFVTLHRGVFPPEYLKQQRNSIVAFIGYNIVFGLTQKNIDMAAHGGGLVMGAVAGAVFARDLLEPKLHVVRRVVGACTISVILILAAIGVHARLSG